MFKKHYQNILNSVSEKKQMLAILIDPDKFNVFETDSFLKTIPKETTHIFVGGSTVKEGITKKVIETLKNDCTLPIIIFPGDFTQISNDADGILFLSLLSGRNPEYLIGQQIKSVPVLKKLTLEIIPTGYILIDGENESAVARVTNTSAIYNN